MAVDPPGIILGKLTLFYRGLHYNISTLNSQHAHTTLNSYFVTKIQVEFYLRFVQNSNNFQI